MFLSLLARMDREGVLDQAVNAGTIMALYIKLAQASRDENLLDEDEDAKTVADGVSYRPGRFDDYVRAYADFHGIALRGPKGLDELLAGCEVVQLPTAAGNQNDPWKFRPALKAYEERHAGHPPPGSKSTWRGIGGDHCDITTWMPAERKNASDSGKDPVTRSMMNAIKKGLIMQPA